MDDIKNVNELHVMISRFPNTQIEVLNDKSVKIYVQNEEDLKFYLFAPLNK